jgi:hypothetical protein
MMMMMTMMILILPIKTHLKIAGLLFCFVHVVGFEDRAQDLTAVRITVLFFWVMSLCRHAGR